MVKNLSDKTIYIITPVKIQREGLCEFLERETGAECIEVQSLHDIPVGGNGKSIGSNLIMIDCFGISADECLVYIEEHGKNLFTQNYVSFFNVIPDKGVEERAVHFGIRGFFYINHPIETIKKGIFAIFNGELWAPRKVMSDWILEGNNHNGRQAATHGLTQRETQILELLAAGYSNSAMADKLCISPHTVKTHLYNIFKKINVPNRFQAALWAVKNL